MTENDMTSSASLPAHAAEAAATEGVGGKFTPGPWRNGFGDFEGVVSLGTADDGNVVCLPPSELMQQSLSRWAANGRLIAAAPDLLAALRLCVQRIERHNLSPDASVVIEVSRAAIAKALGTTEHPDLTRGDPNSPSGSTPLADGKEG